MGGWFRSVEVSKLLEFSFKFSAIKPGGTAFVMNLFWERLKNGAWPCDMSKTTLRNTYLPAAITACKLLETVRETFTYPAGSPDAGCMQAWISSVPWDEKFELPKHSSGALFALRRSTRSVITFCEALLTGAFDADLKSAAGQKITLKPGRELFELERFGGLPLIEQFQTEEHARLSIPASTAAVLNTLGDDADDCGGDVIMSQASSVAPAGDDRSQLSAAEIEKKVKHHRKQSVRKHFESMVSLEIRPASKDAMVQYLKSDPFISSRRRLFVQDEWGSFLFWYDCGGDVEPRPNKKEGMNPFRTLCAPDIAFVRIFFESVLAADVFDEERDVCGAYLGRNITAAKEGRAIMAKAPVTKTVELKLVYQERSVFRGFKESSDDITLCMSHADFRRYPGLPRLHYTLTTTACDCMVMVEPPGARREVPVSDKVAVHGAAFAHDLSPDDDVALFSLEFHWKTFCDLLHQLKTKGVVAASLGSGEILLACLMMNIKIIGFARNAAHKKIVEDFAVEELLKLSADETGSGGF